MDFVFVVVVYGVCLSFHGIVLSMYMRDSITYNENKSYLIQFSDAICTNVLKHESINEERC